VTKWRYGEQFLRPGCDDTLYGRNTSVYYEHPSRLCYRRSL